MLDDCGEVVNCSIVEVFLALISHVVVRRGAAFATRHWYDIEWLSQGEFQDSLGFGGRQP